MKRLLSRLTAGVILAATLILPLAAVAGGPEMMLPVSTMPADQFWPSTILLLMGVGSNGSTTLTDSTGHNTVTVNGTLALSTAQSKYGGSSMAFSGSGAYGTMGGSSYYDLSSGDFTIGTWFYQTATKQVTILSQNSGGSLGYKLFINPSGYPAWAPVGASNVSSVLPSLNAWHYFEVDQFGTANTIYLDGVNVGYNATFGHPASDSTDTMWIGRNTDAGSAWDFNGYLQGLFIVKGRAEHLTNFTPIATQPPCKFR